MLEKYIERFGELTKEDSKNYTFACPLCKAEGGDNSGDNLKIKKDTGLITCFAFKEHSLFLRQGNKDIRPAISIKAKKINRGIDPNKEKKRKKYLEECQTIVNELYSGLISHRGLRIATLQELGVGLDVNKNAWVFPVYWYPTNDLIGFEYRDIQMLPRKKGGKLWHEEGTFSCLAQLTKKPKDKVTGKPINRITIVEGFLDACLLYQYIEENRQIMREHIVTPSCGVQGIAPHINSLPEKTSFSLLLDNDEAGMKARESIRKKSFSGFINYYVPEPYKDFGEWYIDREKDKIF